MAGPRRRPKCVCVCVCVCKVRTLGSCGFAEFQDPPVRSTPRGPGLNPASWAGGAHLTVPPPKDHGKGPVSHEVPLAVLEVAHHLHGRAPGAYSGRAGSAARRGAPGSAPQVREPRARPRAAGQGQSRPRARPDAHAERPERKRARPTRRAGVSEAWPGPGRSSWPGLPPAAGSPAKRPRRCPARGGAAVTVHPQSRARAQGKCTVRASPSPVRSAASTLPAWVAAALGPPP